MKQPALKAWTARIVGILLAAAILYGMQLTTPLWPDARHINVESQAALEPCGGTIPPLTGFGLLDHSVFQYRRLSMFRLVATALLGYAAYRIAREITGSVPEDFGSHLPQQHRRARPKAAAPAAKRRTTRRRQAKSAADTAAEARS